MFTRNQKILLVDHLSKLGHFKRTKSRLMAKIAVDSDPVISSIIQALAEDRTVNGINVYEIDPNDDAVIWGIGSISAFQKICPKRLCALDAELAFKYAQVTRKPFREGEAAMINSPDPQWLDLYGQIVLDGDDDDVHWNELLDQYEQIHGSLPFGLVRA